MEIILAEQSHLEEICTITAQAKAQLKNLGLDQWQKGYPSREVWIQDLKDQTYLMNATHILLGNAAGAEKSDFSKFWRTRNGTADEHTSFTIAYNLAMAAKMAGAEVDYSLVWAAPHGDVDGDGTGSFVEWIHEIVK